MSNNDFVWQSDEEGYSASGNGYASDMDYADADARDARRDTAHEQLEAARTFISVNRFGEAEITLNELVPSLANDPALADLFQTAQGELANLGLRRADFIQKTRRAIDGLLQTAITPESKPDPRMLQVQAYLEQAGELTDEAVSAWELEVRKYLIDWELAFPTKARDVEYERRLNRVSAYMSAEKQRLYRDLARDYIEQLWSLAAEQKTQRVAPSTVLSTYKLAVDAATLAAGRYSDDPVLNTLLEDAENRRVREALVNQIMTSAVQEGEYEIALKNLEGLPDDELVPEFMFFNDGTIVREQFSKRIPARTMRESLTRQASEWALSKKGEYISAAEMALADHNPTAALKHLEKRDRLNRFLQDADRKDFEEILGRIYEQQRRFHSAETIAAEARERAAEEPLEAWRLYREARSEYEWAPVLRETRNEIISRLRININQQLREIEKAFDDRKFDLLRELVAQIERQYRHLEDPIIEQALDRAVRFAEDSAELERLKRALNVRLDRLERDLPNGDPDSLQDELDELKQEYARVIREEPRFDLISQKVSLRQSAERLTEQFKKHLGLQEFVRVEREVRNARAAQAEFPDDELLRRAAIDLEIHLEFLRARREHAAGQYDEALKILDQVQRSGVSDHPDRQAAEILYEEVDRLKTEQQRIGVRIDRAKQRLASDPVSVYQEMVELGVLHERTLERSRQRLLEEAKETGREQTLTFLRAAKHSSENLKAKSIREALDNLNTLGMLSEYEEWTRHFEPLLIALNADVSAKAARENNNELEWRKAISEYEEAVKRARELKTDRNELIGYETRLFEARRAYAAIQLERLRPKAAKLGSDVVELLNQFTELDGELNTLLSANNNDGEVVLWLAQLSEIRAHYSMLPETRQKYFRMAGEDAARVLGMAGTSAFTTTAEAIQQHAEVGVSCARTMLEIDAYLAGNTVEKLLQAQKCWHEQLEPLIEEDAYFEPLRFWWEDRVQSLIGSANKPDDFVRPDNTLMLGRIVKRLLLDEGDPTAESLLKNLPFYVSQLIGKIAQSNAQKTTATGITGSDGLEKLAIQLRDLNELADDLSALEDLVRYFTEDKHRYAELILSSYEQVKDDKAVINTCLNELNTVSQKLKTARDLLNTNRVTANFGETATALDSIQPSYLQHPAVIQVRQAIGDAIQERLTLVQQVSKIQDYINDSNYRRARALMQQVTLDKAVTYGLANQLEMVNLVTNERLNYWTDVEVELGKLMVLLDKLIEFTLPYDDYSLDAASTQYFGRLTGQARPAQVVISWGDYLSRITAELESGRFAQAQTWLSQAMDGGEHLGIGLKTAVARLSTPPRSQGAIIEERYASTKQLVGYSKYGVMLLERLQTVILPNLITFRDEAIRFAEEIANRETLWLQGVENWQSAIHDIARHFDAAGGVSKKPRRRGFKTAVQNAANAYRQCHGSCPKHPYLKEMVDARTFKDNDNYAGLWLFRQATRKVRVNLAGVIDE